MKSLFLSMMLLVSVSVFAQKDTYTVYVQSSRPCSNFTVELGGKVFNIGAIFNYSRQVCSRSDYLKAKRVPYKRNTYHQLGGKSYFYDGTKFYEVNNVTRTCGWPITVAAFNEMRGFK